MVSKGDSCLPCAQVRGVKRVLLWHPLHHDNLYTTGSSSPITDVNNPDLSQYPRWVV